MTKLELDDFDLKILAELQTDNLTTAERLGQKIGLSQSAVQRRSKRLRDAGVIAADVSVLNAKALGFAMTFVVEVSLVHESAAHYDAFKRRMLSAPEIQQCYYITGDGDFFLVVVARDMESYEEISDRLFLNDPNIKRFKTGVVMSRVKASSALPL